MARAQGREPILGRRGHHGDSRCEPTAAGIRQGDPRSDRAPAGRREAPPERGEVAGDPLQHRRRGARGGRTCTRHPDQSRRRAPDRLGGKGGGGAPARRGLQHHQRRHRREGAEPDRSGAGRRGGRGARESHRSDRQGRNGTAHRRQRCAHPRRARGHPGRGAGFSRRHKERQAEQLLLAAGRKRCEARRACARPFTASETASWPPTRMRASPGSIPSPNG